MTQLLLKLPEIVYFATTSQVKFDQYSVIFADHGVELRRATSVSSILIEPQATDEPSSDVNIVAHPLRIAARFLTRLGQFPYMIEDTMLFIEAFCANPIASNGLPGADTKNWWANFGDTGVIRLMEGYENRAARYVCQLGAYLGAHRYVFDRYTAGGNISDSPRISEKAKRDYPRSNPNHFHSIFVPDGAIETLGEMDAKCFVRYDYRRRCAESFLTQLRNEQMTWPKVEPTLFNL